MKMRALKGKLQTCFFLMCASIALSAMEMTEDALCRSNSRTQLGSFCYSMYYQGPAAGYEILKVNPILIKRCSRYIGVHFLLCAIVGKDIEMADQILKYGADVNSFDDEGWSHLMFFCARINDEYKSNVRSNSLHVAIIFSRENFVHLFLEKGADANKHACGYGDTNSPLRLAVDRNNVQVATHLINFGAVVDDHDGYCTVLYKAASKGYAEMVELLLDKGANIDCLNTHCLNTPLFVACEFSSCGAHYIDCIRMLIRYGANTELANRFGVKPIDKCWGVAKTAFEEERRKYAVWKKRLPAVFLAYGNSDIGNMMHRLSQAVLRDIISRI